jgi:hypothetical protein
MKIEVSIWWVNPEAPADRAYLSAGSSDTDMSTEGWVLLGKFEFEVSLPAKAEIAPVVVAALEKEIAKEYERAEKNIRSLREKLNNFLALE